MPTQVINVQLTSICPDVNNFTIFDCFGATISSGWSTAQLLAGITCSVDTACSNVTITSNTFLCNNSISLLFGSTYLYNIWTSSWDGCSTGEINATEACNMGRGTYSSYSTQSYYSSTSPFQNGMKLYNYSDLTSELCSLNDLLQYYRYDNPGVGYTYSGTTFEYGTVSNVVQNIGTCSYPATASFVYTSYQGGTFSFDLDKKVGTGITVSYATMLNYSISCVFVGAGDGLTSSGNLASGFNNLKIRGLNPVGCVFNKYRRGSTMSVMTNQHPSGISLSNNGTFSAGITIVTLKIDSTTCETYIC